MWCRCSWTAPYGARLNVFLNLIREAGKTRETHCFECHEWSLATKFMGRLDFTRLTAHAAFILQWKHLQLYSQLLTANTWLCWAVLCLIKEVTQVCGDPHSSSFNERASESQLLDLFVEEHVSTFHNLLICPAKLRGPDRPIKPMSVTYITPGNCNLSDKG